MKVRSGFVSNSSSSSFVIDTEYLTEEQIHLIKEYREFGPKLFKLLSENKELMPVFSQRSGIEDYELCSDGWSVTEKDGKLHLETWLDNFDMELYLEIIRVDPEAIS